MYCWRSNSFSSRSSWSAVKIVRFRFDLQLTSIFQSLSLVCRKLSKRSQVHVCNGCRNYWKCTFSEIQQFENSTVLNRLTPEKNGDFTLRTHRMFLVHNRPQKFQNAAITCYFGFLFEEDSGREITWLSWRYRIWKAAFSICWQSTRSDLFTDILSPISL